MLTAQMLASRGVEVEHLRTAESYLPSPAEGETTLTPGKRALDDDEAQYSLMVGFGFTGM